MGLREILAGVAELKYNHKLPSTQPAQQHLRKSHAELKELAPGGTTVRISGSAVNPPVVPWIAILDPDVTSTAQEGLYVVYLYSADLTRVYLSMNQGVTQHKGAQMPTTGVTAERAAIIELKRESVIMRNALAKEATDGTVLDIDLGAKGF